MNLLFVGYQNHNATKTPADRASSVPRDLPREQRGNLLLEYIIVSWYSRCGITGMPSLDSVSKNQRLNGSIYITDELLRNVEVQYIMLLSNNIDVLWEINGLVQSEHSCFILIKI